MNICFVTDIYPPDTVGGPGEVVYNLQRYFLSQGISATVFTSGSNAPNYPKTIRAFGGKKLFHAVSPLYYKKIKRSHFDIYNFHGLSGMGLAPILYSQKHKIITTLHSEELTEDRATKLVSIKDVVVAKPSIGEWAAKYLFGSIKLLGTYIDIAVSDQVIAVSQKTKDDFLRQKQISRNKISVIHNGVDSEKFSPKVSGSKIRETYSLINSLVILAVGGNIILKGIIFALYALHDVLKYYPNTKLIIIGVNGRNRERLNLVIENLNIKKEVIIVGKVPNSLMPPFYSAANVVLIPSLSENFPVVALEALSSGKPVLASRVGGIPELVNNNENGFLVSPGNVEQIVEALLHLLENASLRDRMGRSGRKLVEEKFDWSKIGQLYLKEFEKMN